MNCIIVEDEIPAQNILERYIQQMDGLTLSAKCSNAIQALNVLQQVKIDLMFLDVQMPEISGLQMLQQLRHPPKVILTTAFDQYALAAYELDIIDYLLKPISFERFARAVHKARRVANEPDVTGSIKANSPPYIFLKADRKLHKVFLADIVYIEGLSNYLKVHTINGLLVIRETMNDMEALLPSDQFIRVHRSYIVSINHVQYVEGSSISTTKGFLPVGEHWRPQLYEFIQYNQG